MVLNLNDTATADSGIFGLEFSKEESRIHLIPVPWEVTTSYGDGASRGPLTVLNASKQVDLFDIETGDVYRHGYYMEPIPEHILSLNDRMKEKARVVVEAIEEQREHEDRPAALQKEINAASEQVNDWVYEQAKKIVASDKIPAVLGGDHSTPYGLIRALSEKYQGNFGILHIDAHADLREAYQGFTHSHASIMFNVVEKLKPLKLVQVGIRDFSVGEYEYIQKNSAKIRTFFDPILKRRLNRGESWQKLCDEIVSELPANVHLSFDIDGLSPDLCPNTGTPVPGGLSFDQALMLFATVAESGRRIIGFDLNEVAQAVGDPAASEWDGNVGARILFKLCGWAMMTNGFEAQVKGQAVTPLAGKK
jgi:agmatinase